MDTRYLRALVAVADRGGISAAAKELGYAQSSVSAQLQRLEADLGIALLLRTGTGATLTDAGRRVLPHAREALEAEDRMRRAALGGRPRLRVGAQESLAHAWLPEVLAAVEYADAAPGIDVELTVAARSILERAYAAGELDLTLQYDNGSGPAGPHAVIGHDRTVLVAGPGHPLATGAPVAPEALLAYDFLVAEPDCTSQMLVDRIGRDLLSGAQLSMVTGSLSALIRLTGHGQGVSLLPHLAVAHELDAGELVRLPLTEPLRPVSIVARWRERLGPAEEAVRALLDVGRRADPLPEVTPRAQGSGAR
ncbi:LysR family transcriptional regulator [Streptomyces sp. VRA16 Mangrove soil]|uniref:LysR family transcriptional regulator n=1 Tax=Streptomyces sp. VRA16 Mangrove soil TaxID=2817434 RepID=UPI001A9DBA7B|nr:LysR family transcriptional regulator [Streptomyces sp. VRA16 Mangrove soil]MBO1334120.1 LysR family transcriptional regulator [Streptomyces sp. VRA16 Mangrove soil]